MRGWILIKVLLLVVNMAFAQVNTEGMRKETKEGFIKTVGTEFGLNAGNTEHFKFRSTIRIDYHKGKLYSFIVGQYERGIEDDEDFVNKAFAHLRFVYNKRYEAFFQKEFNDLILLEDRNLIGGGLRTKLLKSLYMGNGLMWEKEVLKDNPTMSIIRSTNYLTYKKRFNKMNVVAATVYGQPHIERFKDYRILFESMLNLGITEKLMFSLVMKLRYDSEPPTGVKKTDIELANGFAYSF